VRRFTDCTLSQTLVGWLNQEGRDGLDMWQAMGDTRIAYKIYVGNSERKTPL
jgi:hypothetical protein